uniref:Uncharacterized protein n=1 Tax=Magallana gigas TaxID=29159 RepID=A0A8W8N303_MAGGI
MTFDPIVMFCKVVTTITVCRGLCNLGRLGNVRTNQSSTYKYTVNDIELTADRAVNGKFQKHIEGDCAVTRHYGYYVFINKEEINIKGLTSETPVYHEKDEQHPSVQNIIMFPGGIKGKQMFIYQNKSRPNSGNGEKKNNVLDICEVEIWGI